MHDVGQALGAFVLVFAAEFGDKSQLVVLGLAARYPHVPVWLGAVAAFAVLNALAVGVGATVARVVPEVVVAATVALLFGGFAIATWRGADDAEQPTPTSRNGAFVGTFALLFVAELGDKTQLAVAGLAGAGSGLATWVGATSALAATSTLAVVAGRALLGRVPIRFVRRGAAVVFALFALLALWRAVGLAPP